MGGVKTEVDFVLETVNNLICDHAVSLNQETIIHSDQGGQYTSHRFIQILKSKKLKAADDFETVKRIVDDYIDYYNTKQYQWHLAKLFPDEYYQFCTTGD